MPRLVLFLVVAWLALPGTASAFTKTEKQLRMSDGVNIAATYYVPDGTPPAGGWPAVMLLHGLGETRDDSSNAVGMSTNQIAETQLVPQGYAALTFDARGHGQSAGLVSIDGPREIQDVRELFNWLAAQPGINAQHIGAYGYSYGGGAIWRATAEGVPFAAIVPATTWTDLYSALAPQNFAHSGVVLGFWNSIVARADLSLAPIVNDLLAGQNLGAVHSFADARSSRAVLGNIHVPTFLMQGRRDFAFDVDQALAAYSRLNVPKRLYLADFGHAPSSLPPGELGHVLPEVREWFDRYLKGLPNGIDTRPPVEHHELAARRRRPLGLDPREGGRRQRRRDARGPRPQAETGHDPHAQPGDGSPARLAAAPDRGRDVDRAERAGPPLPAVGAALREAHRRPCEALAAGPREADFRLSGLTWPNGER
jgi:predicted acyl esterase